MQVITLKNKQTQSNRDCKKKTENHYGWKVVGKRKTLESLDLRHQTQKRRPRYFPYLT